MSQVTFHFLRHLPPHPEAYKIMYGRTAIALVKPDDHRAVAGRIAMLARELPQHAMMLVSPTPRTRLTAAHIARGLPLREHWRRDDLFVEQNYGVFSGRAYTDLKQDPAFQVYLKARDEDDTTPPQGESRAEMRARVVEGVKSVLACGRDAIIVTHGSVLYSVWTAYVATFTDEAMPRFTPLSLLSVTFDSPVSVTAYKQSFGPEFRTAESLAL